MRNARAFILAPPVRGAKTQRAARGAALWRVVSDCPRREAATVTGSGGDGRTVVVGADRDLVLRLLLLESFGQRQAARQGIGRDTLGRLRARIDAARHRRNVAAADADVVDRKSTRLNYNH